jgi:nucleotide-binding universal stress UspA family protein
MAVLKTTSSPSCPNRPLRTVLIGTSLEEESDGVVRSGLAIARAAGARVELIHAFSGEPQLPGSETGPAADLARGMAAWGEERLRAQIARLGIKEDELAGAEVLAGEPHRVLIDAASMAGADLIVVGATGCGVLAAELLGSTADRVLRKAACPVLVVRGELPVPPRRVLAPVDLSTLSGDAFRCGLDLLAQLARGERIGIRAVYALSFLDSLTRQRQEPGEISAEEVERSSSEELRRFVAESPASADLAVETAVLPGEARFEILDELKKHPTDLVMLGTHGRGGLDRLMLGSVASTVARKAPCSVLMISPDAALAESIAEAVTARMTPAWHREPVAVPSKRAPAAFRSAT